MTQKEKENRIHSFALEFLERQQIVPNLYADQIIRGYKEGYLQAEQYLEVKEMDTWHLQEKEDIYDAVKDWGLYTFACVMKDGTIQEFIGNLDEDYEGHINVHIDGVNDDYDNVDDIVKWIEFT